MLNEKIKNKTFLQDVNQYADRRPNTGTSTNRKGIAKNVSQTE